MAVLRRIEFWPSSGWDGELWTDDAATDALVRTACRVSEAYGDALVHEQLEGRCTSLRFFSHAHAKADVELQIDTDRPKDWETGVVFVPDAVRALSATDRGLLVVDLIHRAITALAPHRGWSPEAAERARDRVLADGVQFGWASPWKASPERSMACRLVFSVADDGLGRAIIEVKDRRSDDLLARSAPVLAYNAPVNFRASAKTLRWTSGTVHFIPRPGSPHGQHTVSLDPSLREKHPEPRIESADGDSAEVAIPEIVLARYGSHVEDKTPGLSVFLGFGLGLVADNIPDLEGAFFAEAIELEIHGRIRSGEAGIDDWLGGLPVEVVLEYHLPDRIDPFGTYGVRVRRTAKRIDVVLLRDASWFAGVRVGESIVRQETSQVAEQVMAALGARVVKSDRQTD